DQPAPGSEVAGTADGARLLAEEPPRAHRHPVAVQHNGPGHLAVALAGVRVLRLESPTDLLGGQVLSLEEHLSRGKRYSDHPVGHSPKIIARPGALSRPGLETRPI